MAISRALFAMGPAASHNELMGIIPFVDMRPTVGLSVKRAARLEGWTREPLVSVPMAMGTYPAETPTAEPVDEPPGSCYHTCELACF